MKYISPPPSDSFLQTALPYSFLFLLGTLGNTAVLSYVFFITRSLKSSVTALGNTFIYVVALCAVDLLVTISIPFSLSSSILNNWVFGPVGCKLFWAVELSNKMCSTFLLTALAFDRYMAICHPENKRVHQMKNTVVITSSLALLSICLILPIVFSATVKSRTENSKYIYREEEYTVVSYMCVDGMKTEGKRLVSIFLIFFAFLLPCTLLTFFYAKIILRLKKQQRTMLQTRIPIRRITTYTLCATVFYLCCQVPFWVPQILKVSEMFFEFTIPRSFYKFIYYTHLCPFVSASFNWIFYARLNSQFKKGLVLVTERLIRKRTKSLQNGVSTRERETMEDLGMDLISSSQGIVTTCPQCETMSSVMLETVMWFIATALATFALFSSVWVAFISLRYLSIVEELELQILTLIDESMQMLIPTAVVNQIGMADIRNFEMNHEAIAKDPANAKKIDEVQYAQELSRKLDDKDDMYKNYGFNHSPPHVPDARTNMCVSLALYGVTYKPPDKPIKPEVKNRNPFRGKKTKERDEPLVAKPLLTPLARTPSGSEQAEREPQKATPGRTMGTKDSATKVSKDPIPNNNRKTPNKRSLSPEDCATTQQ